PSARPPPRVAAPRPSRRRRPSPWPRSHGAPRAPRHRRRRGAPRTAHGPPCPTRPRRNRRPALRSRRGSRLNVPFPLHHAPETLEPEPRSCLHRTKRLAEPSCDLRLRQALEERQLDHTALRLRQALEGGVDQPATLRGHTWILGGKIGR